MNIPVEFILVHLAFMDQKLVPAGPIVIILELYTVNTQDAIQIGSTFHLCLMYHLIELIYKGISMLTHTYYRAMKLKLSS